DCICWNCKPRSLSCFSTASSLCCASRTNSFCSSGTVGTAGLSCASPDTHRKNITHITRIFIGLNPPVGHLTTVLPPSSLIHRNKPARDPCPRLRRSPPRYLCLNSSPQPCRPLCLNCTSPEWNTRPC